MRGSPLFNLVLVCACLGTFALAITALTGKTPVVAVAQEPAAAADAACTAVLKFAHPPQAAAVHHLGEPLWTATATDTAAATTTFDLEFELPADVGAHGVDLHLTATWPAGTPESVAQLTLEPEALEAATATAWAEGELDEVLTFTWPQPADPDAP